MEPRGCGKVRGASRDSQVSDARFTDGGGDGFDGRAEGVEELRELAGALGPPAFLHHEAGHGDDIGVEGGAVRHGGGGREWSPGRGQRHFPQRAGAGPGAGAGRGPARRAREAAARLSGGRGMAPLGPTDTLKYSPPDLFFFFNHMLSHASRGEGRMFWAILM